MAILTEFGFCSVLARFNSRLSQSIFAFLQQLSGLFSASSANVLPAVTFRRRKPLFRSNGLSDPPFLFRGHIVKVVGHGQVDFCRDILACGIAADRAVGIRRNHVDQSAIGERIVTHLAPCNAPQCNWDIDADAIDVALAGRSSRPMLQTAL